MVVQFTQYFTSHCPQLDLASLTNFKNAAETTNNLTLTVTLTSSDDFQVTLDPSTTIVGGPSTPHFTPTALQPATPHFTPTLTMLQPATPQPESTTSGTMAVKQNVETASLYILVAVSIVSVLVCIVTTIISVFVILGCRYRKGKAMKSFTYQKQR